MKVCLWWCNGWEAWLTNPHEWVGCPIHTVLCVIYAKSSVNYFLSEFESHWLSYSYSVGLHLSKSLVNYKTACEGIFPGRFDKLHWDFLHTTWLELGDRHTTNTRVVGCRIHRLHLCGEVRRPNEFPRYDTKLSDGEASVMLELWGMQSTSSLLSLPGPLWSRMVVPDSDSTCGSNRNKQCTYAKLNRLK